MQEKARFRKGAVIADFVDFPEIHDRVGCANSLCPRRHRGRVTVRPFQKSQTIHQVSQHLNQTFPEGALGRQRRKGRQNAEVEGRA